MAKLTLPARLVVLWTIRFYQSTLSLDHGLARHLVPQAGRCRFYPTCSEYGYQAVERFGICKGGWLAFRRVLRCNPWSSGGVDEVPNK